MVVRMSRSARTTRAPVASAGPRPGAFPPRPDAEPVREFFLEGGHEELGEELGGLLFPDHLEKVRFFPFLLPGDGFVPRPAQLDADRVRPFPVDDPLHEIGAFPGNVGGPDENDFPVLQ
jgi:hypothetical protein